MLQSTPQNTYIQQVPSPTVKPHSQAISADDTVCVHACVCVRACGFDLEVRTSGPYCTALRGQV